MSELRHAVGSGEASILDEVPSVTGVVLWQKWRHLRDWITALPDAQTGLFHEAVAPWVLNKWAEARLADPTIAPALIVLDDWVRSPETSPRAPLAEACQHIAQWAQERGYGETAALFAETAAQLLPQDPTRAILAGKLARSAGQMARAERWFYTSIEVARKHGRWEEYIRGHLGLGILFMLTKKDVRAREHFSAAATKAIWTGYEWLAAEAQHDLFQFMTVRGHYAVAEAHARRALSSYPKHHPRVPFLAADVAYLLICRQRYTQAIELLRRFLRIVHSPPDNVLGLSMLVRALGAAGHERKFLRMRRRLLSVELAATPFEAAALWHLAEAERAMQDWQPAAEHARVALELALAEHDLETAQLAGETLSRVEVHSPVEPEPARDDPQVSELVAQLVTRLTEWAPTKRGRPRRRSHEDWSR
ncbi:MAG TPA: hypothetical protein VGC13_28385 [Longimicrobium sp.]